MRAIDYKEVLAKAEHYKAVGTIQVYLDRGKDIDDYPWHLATGCSEGGSHRMDIATDVRFEARDPITAMEFHWTIEIEPHSANGSGYQIDTIQCRKIIGLLPKSVATIFRAYLSECATALRKRGREFETAYLQHMHDSDALIGLSMFKKEPL